MNTDTPIAQVLRSLAIVVYLAAIGIMTHCVVAGRRPEHFGTLVLAQVVVGTMAGSAYLLVSLRQSRTQRTKRDQTIADMNHHIRNALCVLSFYDRQDFDVEAQQAISAAIHRIEWTLENILPGGWSGRPEPSARPQELWMESHRFPDRRTAREKHALYQLRKGKTNE